MYSGNELVLDIEDQLERVERLIGNYRNSNTTLGIYRYGTRYPILNLAENNVFSSNEGCIIDPGLPLDKNIPYNIVTNTGETLIESKDIQNQRIPMETTPYHPIVAAEILKDMVNVLQFTTNPYKELYLTDTLLYSNHISFLPSYIKNVHFIEDVLTMHCPMLDPDGSNKLFGTSLNGSGDKDLFRMIIDFYMARVLTPIIAFIEEEPCSLYNVHIETTSIRIVRDKDIRAIRYDLAVGAKNLVDLVRKET